MLKSIFISAYLTVAMAITAYAVWMMSQGGDGVTWVGVLLTVAPIVMVISTWMMLRNTPRTSPGLRPIAMLAVIGLILTFIQAQGQIAPMLATLGLIGFFIYSNWYSRFADRSASGIVPGAPLPEFSLLDIGGNTVTSERLADRPAILIFYRGNWCPLCMAQVKELAARYAEIKSYGVRVALISPQPHNNTVGLANKFGVDFDFLTDTDNRVARLLGIDIEFGLPMGMQVLGYDSQTVMPTVIITGKKGQVIWLHETDNYRVRPDPDVYLKVLRDNGIVPSSDITPGAGTH